MAIHRSPSERRALVERWLASPLPTHEFAAHEGVSASSLHRWRRSIEEGDEATRPSAFVEIAVSDLPPLAASIEIELGDALVRVPSGCDAVTLAAVIDAVRRQAAP